MGIDIKFDLKELVELGGSYSEVLLWKVQFGDPKLTEPIEVTLHVLAVNIDHAIAIARAWDDFTSTDDNDRCGSIYSAEAIDSFVISDPRFITGVTGAIQCPDDVT